MTGRIPNPWTDLPPEKPIVAAVDRHLFAQSPGWGQKVHLDCLPTPFLGTPDAPVYVLSLNPSGRDDYSGYEPEFAKRFDEQRRREFGLDAELPYYSLNPEFARTKGADWHRENLRELIAKLNPNGLERTARGVFWLQLFGYQSAKWSHMPKSLRDLAERGKIPSQQFAFQLVRDAIEARKTIIIGRDRPAHAKRGEPVYWKHCVSGLASLNGLIIGHSPRRPYISPGNLGPQNFCGVVAAIRGTDKEDGDGPR